MTSAMVRCGVDAEVLSLVAPRPEWLDAWPATVHGLGATMGSYGYTNSLVPWLQMNHGNYTSILIHGVWRYPSVGVWRALRGKLTPYFLFTHGMLDPWFQKAYPLKHIKKTLFWKFGESQVLRDARAVLFTSEDEKRLARQSFRPFECRELVIGLGTAPPPQYADAQLTEFLDRFPTLRDKRLILFLGRIHRKKGCDLLLRAFGASAEIDPRLHLVMAGPDDENWTGDLRRIALECRIADRITWTGHLDGEQKWGAFRAAEVFALPSHSENYGIAIAESLGCGVPVLITDKVNIWREILEDGGGLAACDDLAGFTALLRRWCSMSQDEQQTFRDNALKSFRSRFELDGFARRFVDFLESETTLAAPVRA